MITKAEAQKIVVQMLTEMQKRGWEEVVLDERLTREEDFGWIFFYNSKEFFETGDSNFALAGNSPLIVDKETGQIHKTGTAQPLEFYIEAFRRKKVQS